MTRLRDRSRSRSVHILEVTSSAFGHGQRLPPEYTRDGANLSPPLTWTRAPESTRSYALVCDDPDAPQAEPFVHWVIGDIPAMLQGLRITSLPEGVSKLDRPREIPGAVQGLNDFGLIGYDGPAPPKGHGTHRYHYRIYALDAVLDLPPGLNKHELLHALEGHVTATGEIIGTYSR